MVYRLLSVVNQSSGISLIFLGRRVFHDFRQVRRELSASTEIEPQLMTYKYRCAQDQLIDENSGCELLLLSSAFEFD